MTKIPNLSQQLAFWLKENNKKFRQNEKREKKIVAVDIVINRIEVEKSSAHLCLIGHEQNQTRNEKKTKEEKNQQNCRRI